MNAIGKTLSLSTLAALTLATFPLAASAQHIDVRINTAPPPVYYPPPPVYYPPPQTVVVPAPPVIAATPVGIYSAQQLDSLTGPIALYADPLLVQVLAASTAPLDIVAADQWLRYTPNPSEDQINFQPWTQAVKVLIHYPSVLQMLAAQISWTQQLGQAFTYQPADVMASVQRLRYEAQASGALVTTPQQQVVVDQGSIIILPPTPQVIYVPVYDPAVVYVRGPRPAVITWGASVSIGGWLDLDFDWGTRIVRTGAHWDDPRIIRDHVFYRPGPPPVRWHPDPRRSIPIPPHYDPGRGRNDGHNDRDEHRGWNPGRPDQTDRDERRGRDSMTHGAPDRGNPGPGRGNAGPDRGNAGPDRGSPGPDRGSPGPGRGGPGGGNDKGHDDKGDGRR